MRVCACVCLCSVYMDVFCVFCFWRVSSSVPTVPFLPLLSLPLLPILPSDTQTSPLCCFSFVSRLPVHSNVHLSKDLKAKWLFVRAGRKLKHHLILKVVGRRLTKDSHWDLGQPLSLSRLLLLSLSWHPLMVASQHGEFPDLPVLTKVTKQCCQTTDLIFFHQINQLF